MSVNIFGDALSGQAEKDPFSSQLRQNSSIESPKHSAGQTRLRRNRNEAPAAETGGSPLRVWCKTRLLLDGRRLTSSSSSTVSLAHLRSPIFARQGLKEFEAQENECNEHHECRQRKPLDASKIECEFRNIKGKPGGERGNGKGAESPDSGERECLCQTKETRRPGC